ncbi:MAG: DNA-directed RNA polymerase subunit omega [Oscillospiraceae bacterium]|nr:DNA-directed RNA polymerase subunit omega [Oscillospiraceae bacterium]
MMLYPPVAELVEKVGSRYQLVNLVARRARALSITMEGEEPSDRKPVSEAIDEVYTGRLTIVKAGQKEKKEHLEQNEKKITAAELKKVSAESEAFSQSEVQDQPDSDAMTEKATEAEGQEPSEG